MVVTYNKKKAIFIQFDIADFYPSISNRYDPKV